MASSGKKKTTMAKLMRESRLRERRMEKQAKKEARKLGLADPAGEPEDVLQPTDGEPAAPDAEQDAPDAEKDALAPLGQAHADA